LFVIRRDRRESIRAETRPFARQAYHLRSGVASGPSEDGDFLAEFDGDFHTRNVFHASQRRASPANSLGNGSRLAGAEVTNCEVIALARAWRFGADGSLGTPCLTTRPTQERFQHYRAIAEAVSLSIILIACREDWGAHCARYSAAARAP